ncbi:hypothetical protein ACR3K2_25730 [Cryptosporidium serpentis]
MKVLKKFNSSKQQLLIFLVILFAIKCSASLQFNLYRAVEEQRKNMVTNPFFDLASDIDQLRKLALTQPEAIKNAGVIVAHVENPMRLPKNMEINSQDILADVDEILMEFMEPKKQNMLLDSMSPYDRVNYDEQQSMTIRHSIERHKKLLRKINKLN